MSFITNKEYLFTIGRNCTIKYCRTILNGYVRSFSDYMLLRNSKRHKSSFFREHSCDVLFLLASKRQQITNALNVCQTILLPISPRSLLTVFVRSIGMHIQSNHAVSNSRCEINFQNWQTSAQNDFSGLV